MRLIILTISWNTLWGSVIFFGSSAFPCEWHNEWPRTLVRPPYANSQTRHPNSQTGNRGCSSFRAHTDTKTGPVFLWNIHIETWIVLRLWCFFGKNKVHKMFSWTSSSWRYRAKTSSTALFSISVDSFHWIANHCDFTIRSNNKVSTSSAISSIRLPTVRAERETWAIFLAADSPKTSLQISIHAGRSTLVTEQLHKNSLFFIKRPKVIASIDTKMFQSI